MLRIDINLVFTIINVLLLFAIVKIFLIKPVHKILDKRRQEVEDKYAEADKVNLSRPCEGRGRSPLQVGAANPFALAM